MLRRSVLALALVVTLSGCASESIRLRHTTTGETVTCGPYSYVPSITLAEIRLRDCVRDFKQAGYERIP